MLGNNRLKKISSVLVFVIAIAFTSFIYAAVHDHPYGVSSQSRQYLADSGDNQTIQQQDTEADGGIDTENENSEARTTNNGDSQISKQQLIEAFEGFVLERKYSVLGRMMTDDEAREAGYTEEEIMEWHRSLDFLQELGILDSINDGSLDQPHRHVPQEPKSMGDGNREREAKTNQGGSGE